MIPLQRRAERKILNKNFMIFYFLLFVFQLMQAVEATNAVLVIASLFISSPALRIINCLAVISHLIFERQRLQSYGFYAVPFLSLFLAYSPILWVLTLLSSLLCIVLPIPHLPKPTGKYSVGTISDYWEITVLSKKSFFAGNSFQMILN